MNPGDFLAELRRRNVYKVAVAYGVVGWLLTQIVTQVFPIFDVPDWAVRLVVICLLLGFPMALIFAWIYELTPEGLRRTDEVPPHRSITRSTGRKLDFTIIGVLLLVLAVLLLDRRRLDPVPDGTPGGKSIAVLPFKNMSDGNENEFFADGVQDDILTALGKIADLKVISRTSVLGYAEGAPRNLRAIAQQLGVAHILEGSVRRAADRVLLSVSLVDARDDRQIWAERYDRTLADSLSLQGELATEIASALHATLSPREAALVATNPTRNPEAYLRYLRARAFHARQSARLADLQEAVRLYEEALSLDGGFALAHAGLSNALSRIHHWYTPTAAVAAKARAEADASLRVQPGLGEGRLARGLCLYWGEGKYDEALEEFAAATEALPNDSAPRLYAASIHRRRGRWSESLAGFHRALETDPRNGEIALQLANCYLFLRDWRAAADAWDRVVALQPEELYPRRFRAYIDLLARGDFSSSERLLAGASAADDRDGLITLARWNLHMMKRDFDAAANALSACSLPAIHAVSGPPLPMAYLEGCVALARNDREGAMADFEIARAAFEAEVASSPDDATRRAYLGFVYACLGRAEDAVREGRRAVALKPESRDALDGAQIAGFLALIYARAGEAEQALDLIERLLVTPAAVDNFQESITRTDLRLRWEWDPLRTHPRFQRLVHAPEPTTIYR